MKIISLLLRRHPLLSIKTLLDNTISMRGTITTDSENAFESLCNVKGILIERIERETIKTPDFFIYIAGSRVVIEIKEFESDSKEEDEIHRSFIANPSEIHFEECKPGEDIRKKIKKAGPQIRQKTGGLLPSMLVLYNKRHFSNPASDLQILVGMYGIPIVELHDPNMGIAQFGGSRQMSETYNTSISALAVLSFDGAGSTQLVVYHNKYSSIPLSPDSLRILASRQFVLVQDPSFKWREI